MFIRVALYLTVHGIEIPYRAFPERVGSRILSLESVDYFGTINYISDRKKEQSLKGHSQLLHMRIRYHFLVDLHTFSSPEPVVSWSRGRLQIKPSFSGDENDLHITRHALWS